MLERNALKDSATVDFDKKMAMVEYDEAKVTTNSLEETVTKTSEQYTVSDMKIALIKEHGYTEKIEKKLPNIKFFEVDNIEEGLDDISTGKYDVLLCNYTVASHIISEKGLKTVEIVGKTSISTDISFGISLEYKPLVSIIDKSLLDIDAQLRHDILRKWTYQKYVEKVDYTLLFQALTLFLILAMAIWQASKGR